MSYKPGAKTAHILQQAREYIDSVPYTVTARWVFYRLLQDGTFTVKADYKRFLGFLSKARKGFYLDWAPDTLSDDTRQALVRGHGFTGGPAWFAALEDQVSCNLDRWQGQPVYLEVWFEAGAMQAQFEHYTNQNIPLLAFHGDVSIPEKWKAACRLHRRWVAYQKPVVVLYYGDLDPKGLQIPESAKEDIQLFVAYLIMGDDHDGWVVRYETFLRNFTFKRVGINDDHPLIYDIPDNPERPGTYQWEALDDAAAEVLIGEADAYLDHAQFDAVVQEEERVSTLVKERLSGLDVSPKKRE